MKYYTKIFEKIVSVENLFIAFSEFRKDKTKRKDVQRFECDLEKNIIELNHDLISRHYHHGRYTEFKICDPKPRTIHKAEIRDRILHHAIFRILNPIFEPTFISNSFSCRTEKGTHFGIDSLEKILRKVSNNGTRPCFVLKCDIQKFFNSVDHEILLSILRNKIKDSDFQWLIEEIIGSFGHNVDSVSQLDLFGQKAKLSQTKRCRRVGIPIGNLTSQLFANIYMNEFDQFVKHELKVKHYCRYTDDFVIVSDNLKYLEDLLPPIKNFLQNKLRLNLHPSKVLIRKVRRGIDFLGYVILPHFRLLRTKTKKRIFSKLKKRTIAYKAGEIDESTLSQSLNSFLGVLSHADAFELSNKLKNHLWFWLKE